MEDEKNPFTLKFMDGSPVPEEYRHSLDILICQACQAEELFGLEFLDGGGI